MNVFKRKTPLKKGYVVYSFCFFLTIVLCFSVEQESDDGTETNQSLWLEDGVDLSKNYIGQRDHNSYEAGFRFTLRDIDQGDEITYARLRLASLGGQVTRPMELVIQGALQESPTTFSQTDRPSQKTPKTLSKIKWKIHGDWDKGSKAVPLYYSSPNVAPILNEILALPRWGGGAEGKTLILTIKKRPSPYKAREENYLVFEDFKNTDFNNPPVLEVFKTPYDAIIGKECLGRVTDASVTVSFYSLIQIDGFIEYGTSSGVYSFSTPVAFHQENDFTITLDNLIPDTQYFYRFRFRKAGSGGFEKGEERRFHTQRSLESKFSFSIMADEHLQGMFKNPQKENNKALYLNTLENIKNQNPDFLISLGDFVNTEFYTGRNAANLQEAADRYLLQRRFLDRIVHSIPFYLVLGNHEGESGWRYLSTNDEDKNLAVFSAIARKAVIPNPRPNGFYWGNTTPVPEYGLREDYYAWEWGDALFIVLNPFWSTKSKPHLFPPGSGGSQNGWDWTLGKTQYQWLNTVLDQSDRVWKFVFIHHLVTSSVIHPPDPNYYQSLYGRGGIEVAKYKVDKNPSFEWGGEDAKGNNIFSQERPGWNYGPIHDLLKSHGVDIVFHGHDHFYAKQDLDGIVYQECPQPGDSDYDYPPGFKKTGKYKYGVFYPSSGHIQVSVDKDLLMVDYVRSYLPGDGKNAEIAHSYTLLPN